MGENELRIAVEEPRSWARRLTITVSAARIDRERQGVARKLAQRLKLPGFRKGKVPTQVLQKKYGPAIERETLEQVVGEAYREAIQRENLHPITQASIEEVDWQPGSDLTFRAEFEVRPDIELQRLGGFRIEAPKVEVPDAEIDRVLESIRSEHALWHPVEDAGPSPGDRVKVHITALREAGDVDAGRPYELVLGEGQAVPDVEAAILTLKSGAEGEFSVHIADEEASPEGAGREQQVRIRLEEVKRPELPALDDAFARSVGDFEDLATLRGRVREDLEREAAREQDREVRRRLLEAVIDANPFDVPSAMVEQYLEGVLQQPGFDESRKAEFRESARPAAEQALKRILVVDRIAKLEGLDATADEVEERVQSLAQRLGRQADEIRSQLRKGGRLTAIAEEIAEDKVFSYLKSMSTID